MEKIWNENMEFLRDLMFFDASYIDLLKNFISNFPIEDTF